MKKKGFTLAEVLITLAIIGVVATLTLPALMTNTGEQQAKTALKKGINTLTEAAQMNSAIAGFDYNSLTVTTHGEEDQSLYSLLASRANIDYKLSGTSTDASKLVNQGASTNYTIFFRDGSALTFKEANTTTDTTSGAKKNSELQDDGLPYGIAAVYDTNGSKGPNLLSNCNKNSALKIGANTTDVKQAANKELNEVCTKSSRVIKDQFGVRLRGSYVVPNGPAARWAFSN